MDYTKLPKQLLYRERRSLEEFTDNNSFNADIVNSMLDIHCLQSTNFKERTLDCFNAAYYICTLIQADAHPEWSFPLYCDFAFCNRKDDVVSQAVTLSLVSIYIHYFFGEKWSQQHKRLIDKLDEFLKEHWIVEDPFAGEFSYKDACIKMDEGSLCILDFKDDFALRTIDRDAIVDLQTSNFDWTRFTDFYRDDIMREIVFKLGKSEEEMNQLVASFRHDAEMFYTHDSLYYKELCGRLLSIEHDIYNYYHYEEDKDIAMYVAEQKSKLVDPAPLQARIAELEAQINDTQQNGNENPEYIESLNRQLAEEKTKNANLEAEIKQLKEVIELDKELDNDATRLQIDERIIFVSTVLGITWNSDLTNQTQLAKLIEHFSGDNNRSIRSRIVAINSEMKKELENPGEGLTQGTKEAINNVISWLGKVTRGKRNTPTTDALIQEIKDVFLNTKE